MLASAATIYEDLLKAKDPTMKSTTRKSIFVTLLSAMFVMPAAVYGQDDSDQPKFKFSPSGRILADGAIYAPDGDGFADGVAIPDVRLGAKVSYGKWSGKIDIGYGFGKLSMKDVFIQYSFNDFNYVKAGYFVHQFGLNAATSSSMKPSMEVSSCDTYFNATGRNLGIQYVHDKGDFFAGVSVMAGTSISTPASDYGKVSAGATTRLVWRPYHATGQVVQIGMSGWYQSAMHKKLIDDEGNPYVSPGYFDFSCQFPTRVSKVDMLGANVSDAKGLVKLSPEWLFSKDRVALEGQYYYMNVQRKNGLPSYKAQGVYGLFRTLLIGDSQYGYSHGDAGLATPGAKTLECVLGYSYTNGRDKSADIFGGISNDYSVTFNYYVNKYVTCRLRYSYTNVWGSDVMHKRHENIKQARIMFKF